MDIVFKDIVMASQNSAKLQSLQAQASTLGMLVIDASTTSPRYQIFFEGQLVGETKSMKATAAVLPDLYRAIQEQLALQVASEVTQHLETQAQEVAPEFPEFAAGIAGDSVCVQLKPQVSVAEDALKAFLNHTSSTEEVANRQVGACAIAHADFDASVGLLFGGYYCDTNRAIASVKIFINFDNGTYSRHDEFPNGSSAGWGSEYGMNLANIDFDNWESLTPPPPEPEDFIQVRTTSDPTVFQIFSRPPSRLKPNEYQVKLWESGRGSCTCPHHCHRQAQCKHIQAVNKFLEKRKTGRSLSPTIGHRQHGYFQSEAEKAGEWKLNLRPTGLYTHEHFRQRERSQAKF